MPSVIRGDDNFDSSGMTLLFSGLANSTTGLTLLQSMDEFKFLYVVWEDGLDTLRNVTDVVSVQRLVEGIPQQLMRDRAGTDRAVTFTRTSPTSIQVDQVNVNWNGILVYGMK